MNEKIIIERAKASDAAEMLEYLKKIGGETDNLSFGAEGLTFSAAEEEEYLSSLEKSDSSAIFVARAGGKIVGDASYSSSLRERLRHRGELGISVIKEMWGQGIGSRLMETIIDFAKNTARADLISLEVRSDNVSAIRLYAKYGFEKIGTFRGFMKINGELVDFDLMNLYF